MSSRSDRSQGNPGVVRGYLWDLVHTFRLPCRDPVQGNRGVKGRSRAASIF